MKRWWLVMALLLSVGINLGMLVMVVAHRLQAPQRQPLRPPTPEAGVEMLADRLRLDEPARSAFIDRQLSFFDQVRPLRQQLLAQRRQLRAELTAAEPDRRRVVALVAEMAETYRAVEQAVTFLVLDSRELLTPRQQRLYLRFVGRLRDLELGGGPPGDPRGRYRSPGERRGPPRDRQPPTPPSPP